MAWFTYECKQHGAFRVTLDEAKASIECPDCKIQCNRVLKPATARTIEYIDTGIQARKVEWQKDMKEILDERADKHGRGGN